MRDEIRKCGLAGTHRNVWVRRQKFAALHMSMNDCKNTASSIWGYTYILASRQIYKYRICE